MLLLVLHHEKYGSFQFLFHYSIILLLQKLIFIVFKFFIYSDKRQVFGKESWCVGHGNYIILLCVWKGNHSQVVQYVGILKSDEESKSLSERRKK